MTNAAGVSIATVCWALPARRGLPKAILSLLIQPSLRGRPCVGIAHVSVGDPEVEASISTTFDDGRVVVDRTAGGRVLGTEFLEDRDLVELPEFAAAMAAERNEEDRTILHAAHATAMLNWARVDFYFESATDRGPLADDDERLDVFVHPSPSLRRWRTGSILPVAKRRR